MFITLEGFWEKIKGKPTIENEDETPQEICVNVDYIINFYELDDKGGTLFELANGDELWVPDALFGEVKEWQIWKR